MRRRQSLMALVAMVLAGVGFGTACLADEIDGDLKTLQGRWTGATSDGAGIEFKFEEKKAQTIVGDMTFQTEIELDEKASPRTIDFKILEGPPDTVGLKALAIYKLSDDKKMLTVCVSPPGQPRPTEFVEVEGESFIFELERAID